jgi:predicted RNA binding protein YcfA (HicA-like mRNA interferase family)
LSRVEAFLDACGWERRMTKSGHRAWTKPGKRTLIVPVHSTKVSPAVVRSVLDANADIVEA